jgi:hypothetical protein
MQKEQKVNERRIGRAHKFENKNKVSKLCGFANVANIFDEISMQLATNSCHKMIIQPTP